MAAAAFWGLMRFGEVSVKSRADFDPKSHLTRANLFYDHDLDGRHLPSAKTARPGEVQHVFLSTQRPQCPLKALFNLAKVVPTSESSDPLFS